MVIHTCLLTFALTGGIQDPPPPPPPPPRPPSMAPRDPATIKKGTSVIKGHVFSTDGRPLRRAQIRAAAGDPRDAPTTTTGLEGEYELRDLPAGRYTIRVTRNGYLPAQYGEEAYGQAGTPITLADGATVEKIDVVMQRAGVISGRVTDETGDPAAGVDIRAMQMQYFRGKKRIVPVSTWPVHVTTDDSGQYRFTGLPPGEYFVSGRLRDTWMSDEEEPQTLSYAPTYFPGTADVSQARRIKIAGGQEAGAIDFTLVPARAAKLSGTALASDGTPLSRGRIMVTQDILGPAGGTSMSFAGTAVLDEDGSWTVRDVPPGEYTVRASGNAAGGRSENATLTVTVYGADLEGLVVRADPGGLISGRVVADTGEPLPSGSRPVVNATLISMESTMLRPTQGVDDGVVGADGTFTLRSASGPMALRVLSLPRGWAVRSVGISGRDYVGLPVDLQPGQMLSDVTIVVSQGLTSISGHVSGEDGKPASGTVLLFPADPARWPEALANQRITRPERTGAYTFDNVRPGEYFLIAVASMESWQMNDPEFLDAQRGRATKLTVGSELATIDLKVVR
ncbi:MAG TPA: carboxypeptidase regulatory-like domain-containing protein [Vicinamibacterales bacterium]